MCVGVLCACVGVLCACVCGVLCACVWGEDVWGEGVVCVQVVHVPVQQLWALF